MKLSRLVFVLGIAFIFVGQIFGGSTAGKVYAYKIAKDFVPDGDGAKAEWVSQEPAVIIGHDWRGVKTHPSLKTTVKALWSEKYLYFLYTAAYENLAVDTSIKADANGDCWGIWERDVVEVFIGDNADIKKYQEFVVSPLNQNIDIRHNKNLSGEKSYDTSWNSGWDSKVVVDRASKSYAAEIRIPFATLSKQAIVGGKQFRANFFRCAGSDKTGDRAYLSAFATGTVTPNFHVPEKFGTLELVGDAVVGEPAFMMDFDESEIGDFKVAKGVGLADSGCGDFSKGECLVLDDAALLESLDEAKSITVTGWFRSKIDLADQRHQYLLNCGGRFTLTSHGLYKGRMWLDLPGCEKKKGAVWCTWFSPFLAQDKWVFFAFTYDGTKGVDNGGVYVGTEGDKVYLDRMISFDGGELGSTEAKSLIIGARTEAATSPFRGLLDNIRIYVSKTDDSAALNIVQLEKIRKSDLGVEYAAKVDKTKTDKIAEEKRAREEVRDKYYSEPFNAVRIDSLDWVYPDRAAGPKRYGDAISVPRGGKVPVQIAVMSEKDATCKVSVEKACDKGGRKLDGKITVSKMIAVPVEANNNGGSRTSVTTRSPALWKPYFSRIAPFEVYDVLVESNLVQLKKEVFASVLVDIEIPVDACAGVYETTVTLSTRHLVNGEVKYYTVDVPVCFEVFDVAAPTTPVLHSTHWLSVKPEDLVIGNGPKWWSERHFKLLKSAGEALREFGQDTMYTPLIDGEYPLIKTIGHEDGTYTFDYKNFDRWMKMYLEMGFRRFDGHHIAGGHHPRSMDVYAFDEAGGKKQIFTKSDANDVEGWFAFLPDFYTSLYGHLKENGWADKYNQCQLDEPGDKESYKRISDVTHKYMPGIPTKDAINGEPDYYSKFVDVHVFGISSLAAYPGVADDRRSVGKETWLYHCCSPYPPMPNRHIDEALTSSRLYPWLAYQLKATGFLHWAANMYRGANPYKTSVGPIPGGSQNPGHPSGDNWLFYPGPKGLRGSLRMVAMREGLLDHSLLMRLAAKDRKKADEIMESVARSLVDYQTDACSYHSGRRELLVELSKIK
jgi:hypothetical protein